jgi:hypothetical protein
MNSSERSRLAVVLALAAVVLAAAPGAIADTALRPGAAQVLEESDQEMVLRVHLKDFALDDLTADGVDYKTISGSDFVTLSEPGEPDLPGYSYLLAVPAGGGASLVSVSGTFDVVATGVRIAPVARPDTTFRGEHGLGSFIYVEDTGIYGSPQAFPEGAARIDRMGRMRGRDIARVAVIPFSYEPATGTLRAAREITIRLRFEGGSGSGAPGGGARVAPGVGRADGASWEALCERALLNPDQARRWRVMRAPMVLGGTVLNDRMKMEISETGIYRLTYAALSAAGLPASIPVGQIFIYRDEFIEGDPDSIDMREASILVRDANSNGLFDAGDEIVFYARDFYAEFGARWTQDLFFNRNVYWLSWGEGEHARMAETDGWPDLESPGQPTHYTETMHFEEDLSFVQFPPHVSADWYYWKSFTWTEAFDMPPIDMTYPTSLRVNFIGYLITGSSARDEITLSVTNCDEVEEPVDTVEYFLPGMRNFTVALEPGMLCEGENSFNFKSSVTSTPGSCLDWFEITCERKYEAVDDFIAFTSGDSLGEIEIDVSGFTSGDISLFDISDPYAVKQVAVPPGNIVEDAGVYSLTFRDSISDTTFYIAVTSDAVRDIESAELKKTTPPTLRTTPGGYLIISHPDFASAMQPLIDQREAQGHTVVLATTDQVYDDFNNGMKSDTAVRRYIEYGYFNYGTEYALLVGDSNVDRRGLLLNSPSDPSDVDYLSSHAFLQRDRQGLNYEIWPNELWFASVDGPDDELPDVYLGRLPVGSRAEIDGAIQKILTFENYAGSDPWKKRILLIADDQYGRVSDICWTGQAHFMRSCDSVAVIATDNSVVAADTLKYYLERCTKYDQPELRCPMTSCCTVTYITMSYTRFNCTPEVKALLNDGSLFANFQGHANENVLTHETLIREDIAENDILDLRNVDKPFVFFGYGCYISNFHRFRERQPFIQDCIGEKFVINPEGAGSACFASACAEPIVGNERFNPYVAHAIFDYLTPYDTHGNPVAARVLLGEVALTALLRYGSQSYIDQHALFGDPGMIIDMGPPLITTTVNDSTIGGDYVFSGDEPETLKVVSDIRDDEAIMATGVSLVDGSRVTEVPAEDYTEEALMDTGYVRSRAYEVRYSHVPRLGEYTVRLAATDYSGHEAASEFGVATGGARYYKEGVLLEEGGTVVIDQTLRVILDRPGAFTEDDISVSVDTIPASEFDDYTVKMNNAGGTEWEVSFMPTLSAGEHTIFVDVEGFKAQRGFVYVPGDVDFFVDGRPLYENDYTSSEPVLEVYVKGTTDPEVVGITLDGQEPDSLWYEPDSSEASLTVGLAPALGAGEHDLGVTVDEIGLNRHFRVSDEFALTEVSAYPNPFSDFTHIYYTLTSEAVGARLEVYTVAGRKIFEDGMLTPYAGYNIYRWNGRDSAGDEIANGTYIYRLTVKSGSREREFTAPIVRLK